MVTVNTVVLFKGETNLEIPHFLQISWLQNVTGSNRLLVEKGDTTLCDIDINSVVFDVAIDPAKYSACELQEKCLENLAVSFKRRRFLYAVLVEHMCNIADKTVPLTSLAMELYNLPIPMVPEDHHLISAILTVVCDCEQYFVLESSQYNHQDLLGTEYSNNKLFQCRLQQMPNHFTSNYSDKMYTIYMLRLALCKEEIDILLKEPRPST